VGGKTIFVKTDQKLKEFGRLKLTFHFKIMVYGKSNEQHFRDRAEGQNNG
jgi:hypothetical protein